MCSIALESIFFASYMKDVNEMDEKLTKVAAEMRGPT